MDNTLKAYDLILGQCRNLFILKMKDYGTAWRILRPSSVTDQIFIKASRIRNIQKNKNKRINESIENEFIGIINYSIMALIQLKFGIVEMPDLSDADALNAYDKMIVITKNLMEKKNYDYGEIWRQMRISSITDLIIQKLLRIKKLEDNNGETQVSEGFEANYMDIINYSTFALILIEEQTKL